MGGKQGGSSSSSKVDEDSKEEEARTRVRSRSTETTVVSLFSQNGYDLFLLAIDRPAPSLSISFSTAHSHELLPNDALARGVSLCQALAGAVAAPVAPVVAGAPTEPVATQAGALG